MSSQTLSQEKSKSLVPAAAILALGLVIAAFLLGNQTKTIGTGRSTVTVKGLSEKAVKADAAQWAVSTSARGNTFAEALANLRKEKVALDEFLQAQGFSADARQDQSEDVSPYYIEKEVKDRVIQVQDGYQASQAVVISSKDLAMIGKAYKAALDYKAADHEIDYGRPQYLVSNLEEIKMSLISSATENASTRAKEFIKHGDNQLGAIRSASQGAFYILPDTGNVSTDEYGGVYDKSTIDKIARVVVTIEFNLK